MSKQCFPAGIPEVNNYTIVTSLESQRLTTMAVTYNGIPVTNYFTQVPNVGIPEIKYYITETFCSNLHRNIREQPLLQKEEKDKMQGIAEIAMWYFMKGSYLQF